MLLLKIREGKITRAPGKLNLYKKKKIPETKWGNNCR
jgi:hypothetical protein